MPKKQPKPRIVVYLENQEMHKAVTRANQAGHKNAHRWGTAIIKKELSK